MALRPAQHDEFEDLLREAHEAEQAGVFRPTQVDIGGLVSRPVRSPSLRLYRLVLAGVPMAACVALFLGLAAFWNAGNPSSRNPNGNASVRHPVADPAARCEALENLRACFSGPGIPAGSDCQCGDKDADGDVDLRDLGMFQMGDAAP